MITIESTDGLTFTSKIEEDGEQMLVKSLTIKGEAGDGHWYVEYEELLPTETKHEEPQYRTVKKKCVVAGGFRLELDELEEKPSS